MNPIFKIKYHIRRFTLHFISEQFSVRNRGKRDLGNWGEGVAGKAMMMMMTMMMVMMTDDDEEKDDGDDEYVNLSR